MPSYKSGWEEANSAAPTGEMEQEGKSPDVVMMETGMGMEVSARDDGDGGRGGLWRAVQRPSRVSVIFDTL